jgi:hypothetical protein
MTLWRTIARFLAHWTDTVATGVIALASRFFSPQHLNLTLDCIIASENEGVAVFIDTRTRDTVRPRTGEDYSGWILQLLERSAAGQKATAPVVHCTRRRHRLRRNWARPRQQTHSNRRTACPHLPAINSGARLRLAVKISKHSNLQQLPYCTIQKTTETSC